MRPLRIAHVTATFPPYLAGTGIVAFHNATELARRGHDVHVFTAMVPDALQEEIMAGVHVHRLRPLVRIGNAPLLPQMTRLLRGFDLIHLHYPFISGAEFTRLAAWRNRTPLVLSFHNDLIGSGARAILFRYYQRLSSWITVEHANLLCAVSIDHYDSTELATSLHDRGPSVVELPNGVDINVFSPGDGKVMREYYGIPFGVKVGLFVAALDQAHHFKGLERLLAAWSQINTDASLLIVGEGDLRPFYENQSAHLGMNNRVIFAGRIKNADLPGYYRAADLTILPTDPPESFGLVLIESLACGTPVVASKLPGVRTVVADGVDGRLVAPGDVAELVSRLDEILNLPDAARREMGMAGRRKVEARYNWERIGDALEEIYTKVIGHTATQPLIKIHSSVETGQ